MEQQVMRARPTLMTWRLARPALLTLAAIACLVLGFQAFGKLGELQSLREAVVRSHSNPPPQSEREAQS